MKAYFLFALLLAGKSSVAQRDSVSAVKDTVLGITGLSPFITLAVDSVLDYRPGINKTGKYFWYLRNSPVGMKINKDSGNLYFKADKSYFLSGKLQYDYAYKVVLGVSNTLTGEKADTSFTIIFYNTEIIPSRLKPSVGPVVYVEEGDTVNFRLQCEEGSFPIENITYYSTVPMKSSTVSHCDDTFWWAPPFDFVKEGDSAKVKVVTISFIGTTRFMARDTAQVRIIVKDAVNYPLALQEYQSQAKAVRVYILQLKYSFLQLDKGIKKVKNTRTAFDITSSATALSGTVLASSSDPGSQKMGTILPGVGVSLVPVKEAVSPQKVNDQNQASLVRSSIKRLEYMLDDNALLPGRDLAVPAKTAKLKDELKQIQIQLIDIPIGLDNNMTEKELDDYFSNPKVNKKYRTKKK